MVPPTRASPRHGLRARAASLQSDGEPASRRDPTRRGREVTDARRKKPGFLLSADRCRNYRFRRFSHVITAPGGSGTNVLLHDALAAIFSVCFPSPFERDFKRRLGGSGAKRVRADVQLAWFESRPRSRVKKILEGLETNFRSFPRVCQMTSVDSARKGCFGCLRLCVDRLHYCDPARRVARSWNEVAAGCQCSNNTS